jgi:hypothetical protein
MKPRTAWVPGPCRLCPGNHQLLFNLLIELRVSRPNPIDRHLLSGFGFGEVLLEVKTPHNRLDLAGLVLLDLLTPLAPLNATGFGREVLIKEHVGPAELLLDE